MRSKISIFMSEFIPLTANRQGTDRLHYLINATLPRLPSESVHSMLVYALKTFFIGLILSFPQFLTVSPNCNFMV